MEEQYAPINADAHHESVDWRCALRSILESLLTRYAARPVHCCHWPGSSEHVRLAGTVSSGIAIKPD
eukprot:6179905-Pleurochrysis_carterae.AAC.1